MRLLDTIAEFYIAFYFLNELAHWMRRNAP
jgi:hypothetical protein